MQIQRNGTRTSDGVSEMLLSLVLAPRAAQAATLPTSASDHLQSSTNLTLCQPRKQPQVPTTILAPTNNECLLLTICVAACSGAVDDACPFSAIRLTVAALSSD